MVLITLLSCMHVRTYVPMFPFHRTSSACTTALKKEYAGMASASAIRDTLGRTAGVPSMM